MRNGIGNDSCHIIQWNIVDTESPDKVKDVNNVLLVRLGCQKILEWSTTTMYMLNSPQLIQRYDAVAHDQCFTKAIIDLQNRDRLGSTSVNYAFVFFDTDKEAFVSRN